MRKQIREASEDTAVIMGNFNDPCIDWSIHALVMKERPEFLIC